MALNDSRKFDMNGSVKLDYWQQQYNKMGHNPDASGREYQDFLHGSLMTKGFNEVKLQTIELRLSEYKNKGMDCLRFRNLKQEDICKLVPEERLAYRDFIVSRVLTGDACVARTQANLMIAGYDLGQTGTYGVDGDYGSLTEKAIKSFQESAGLEATGKLDQETVRALDLMTKLGMTKKEIEGMEKKNNPNNFEYAHKTERFVLFAKQELSKGFIEIDENNKTPYGKWYGIDGQPWCAMFVSWCANQAGILNTTVPRFASVQSGKEWYIEKERYRSRNTGYVPNSGDIIFFRNKSGQNHTGIVIAYDEKTNTVYTIEGNSSNSIAARKYNLNNSYIQGFGINGGTSKGEIPKESTNGIGLNTR